LLKILVSVCVSAAYDKGLAHGAGIDIFAGATGMRGGALFLLQAGLPGADLVFSTMVEVNFICYIEVAGVGSDETQGEHPVRSIR
jgi:hypothetical protein